MSVAQKVFPGICVIAAACLCYYALIGGSQSNSAEQPLASARQLDGAKPLPPFSSTTSAIADAPGKQRCADMMQISPFGSGPSNCSNDPVPLSPTAGRDVTAVRAKLDLIWPCQVAQQPNATASECAKTNADAANLVWQLEALAEQGDRQASTDLANLVQSRKKSATGEYFDALDHAEARLLRIAIDGGVEAEKPIPQPSPAPAGGV